MSLLPIHAICLSCLEGYTVAAGLRCTKCGGEVRELAQRYDVQFFSRQNAEQRESLKLAPRRNYVAPVVVRPARRIRRHAPVFGSEAAI